MFARMRGAGFTEVSGLPFEDPDLARPPLLRLDLGDRLPVKPEGDSPMAPKEPRGRASFSSSSPARLHFERLANRLEMLGSLVPSLAGGSIPLRVQDSIWRWMEMR